MMNQRLRSRPSLAVGVGALVLLAAGLAASGRVARTQTAPALLVQETNHSAARPMSASERATLGDPMFNLVLRDHPGAFALAIIDSLLQPATEDRVTFVVDEEIASSAHGGRRAVLAYRGTNAGEPLEPNVMLSIFFGPGGLPDTLRAVEAWGWDAHRGRYNYYKLDNSGTPDGRMAWKFRGSSENADLLSLDEREGTCMACHITGAPIMKELAFPWNNWGSFESNIPYLGLFGANRWPVAESRIFTNGRLGGAEQLEGMVAAAINQFSNRRINNALARRDSDGNILTDEQGRLQMVEGRRVLRHLFETTEYNLVSARAKSGMHPLGDQMSGQPATDVVVPATFFLNHALIAGNSQIGLQGLALASARPFSSLATLTPGEYRMVVEESGQRLGGQLGDADFAWFVPEAGHVDNSMVDRLLIRGVVNPAFVAAGLGVDLETPLLSADRASLLRFVPDTFHFTPRSEQAPAAGAAHPDALTRQVIENLRAAGPAPGSPAAELLRRLEHPDPVALLDQDVRAYHQRIADRLGDPTTKAQELERLHDLAIERRRQVLTHRVLRELNETGNRLLPLP